MHRLDEILRRPLRVVHRLAPCTDLKKSCTLLKKLCADLQKSCADLGNSCIEIRNSKFVRRLFISVSRVARGSVASPLPCTR